MSTPIVLAWLAAAIALLAGTVTMLEEARRDPGAPVPRGRVLAVAAALAGLAAAAVWAWSGAIARRGDAQLRARGGDATAQVQLRSATLAIAEPATVGFSADAALELPSSWSLDEAARGADVLRIALVGDQLEVTPLVAADSSTRLELTAGTGPAPIVHVRLSRGDRAIASLDIARLPGAAAVRLWPRVRRGATLVPHAVELAGGEALQLGAASGAVPGLTAWELPAPRGHVDVLVAPADTRAPCAAWADGSNAASATARGDHACTLQLSSVYDLEVRRLVPDVAGLEVRAGWAAAVMVLPIVLALLALATRPRGAIDRARLARLAALGWLAVALTALAIWRLLWAHRIDMLRDLEPVAARTLLAQVVVVVTGAGLAGVAAAVSATGRARLPIALVACLAWLAIGGLALLGDAAALTRLRGVGGLAAAPLLLALLAGAARRAPRLPPIAVLAALATVAVLTAQLAPRLVAVKLGVAWLVPLLAYQALRDAAAAPSWRTSAVALAAISAALGALFRLDAGVTLAVTTPGVIVAVVVVTHDLLYHPRDARLLDRWERHQLPLTLGHAAVLGGSALIALVACIADATLRGVGDVTLPARATGAALHVPALIAVALIASALVARRRGAVRAAMIPAAVALIAALVWVGRAGLVERAVGSDDASGKRLAAVVAPGYALLRDERSLVAALTAWRETAVAGAALDGEGYFAATITDPGVTVSIENDYLAVLIVRETGVVGAGATAGLLLTAIAGAWWLGAAARRPGARGTRARTVAAIGLGAVTVYQPLAALGVLPLTGVSWPGLGLDSPSDALVHLAVLLWLAAPGVGRAEPHELAVRTAPRWRRARAITTAACALAIIAGVAVVARAAGFAARRGHADPVAAGIDRAAAYAATLACPAPAAATVDDAIPVAPIGIPLDAATGRYHRELRARWRAARPAAIAAARAYTAGAACRGSHGAWRLHDRGDRCELSLDAGWPTVTLAIRRAPGAGQVRCAITADRDVLAPLRRAPPPPPPRIRVVGAPTGADDDRAELVADHLIVRLRPGAGAADVTGVEAGLHAVERVTLAPGVTVTTTATGAHLDAAAGAARLLIAEPGPAGPRWRRVVVAPGAALSTELAGVAVLVVDAGPRRRAWLVRGPSAPGEAVAPLLADDLGAGAGARRHYVYGGALPELGWVNPYDVRRSLGLDGWIHAAIARPGVQPPACGTLAPPAPAQPPCTPSRHDGVLECRVSLQPELTLQLRHLTELIALDPGAFAGTGAPATRAAFVLLRGDTGELLAEGDFVPGRAGTAYAPGTAAIERALIGLREAPGEASAEKLDLHRAIAVGSTLKPLVARAAERVAPSWTSRLALRLDRAAPPSCHRGRRDVHGILGHCPPRELLDQGDGWVGFHDYLATSSNAYQATLGLVALGWPDGSYRLGDLELGLAEVLSRDVAGWPAPIAIAQGDRRVVGARSLRLEPLRATPFWQRLEGLIGRPLCTLGNQVACRRAADRRDLCAARAMPVDQPSADLRHLIALGPSTFDLYPAGAADAGAVPVAEYFQLLRGSGVHALGSLAQLTDAFNRLVFDPTADGPLRLAASWFPVPVVGVAPRDACTLDGDRADQVLGAAGGLCGVVRAGGTAARAMRPVLADPRLLVYGAKTGTIDGLGDVAERPRACAAWNRAHTLAGAPARAADQPYWLRCGDDVEDDSLFVVSLGVRIDDRIVPLTLGLHLERSGKGVASAVARHYLAAIADHLAGAGASP